VENFGLRAALAIFDLLATGEYLALTLGEKFCVTYDTDIERLSKTGSH
jgi:hypothetical protein